MLWLGSEIAFCLPVLMSLSFYSNFIVIGQFIAVLVVVNITNVVARLDLTCVDQPDWHK